MTSIRTTALALIAILAAGIIAGASAASAEIRSGPGWNLTIREEPLTDPATGNQYASAAEFIRDQAPDVWDTLTPDQKQAYGSQPAVKRRIDLFLTPGPDQVNRTAALAGRNLTEAEFYAAVYPDLWAVIPSWQKEIWANRTHPGGGTPAGTPAPVTVTAASTAATGADPAQISARDTASTREAGSADSTPVPSGDNSRGGTASGDTVPSGSAAAGGNSRVSGGESGTRSGYAVESAGGNTTVSTSITPRGIQTHVTGAVGTVSAFASVHSRSRSSSLDYEKFTSVSGIIDHFDFAIEYEG